MATGVAEAFPDKLLAQEVVGSNDFPPIGEDGQVRSHPTAKDQIIPTVKDQILRSGLTHFPGRFAVQWNGLRRKGKYLSAVVRAGRAGAVIGWQTRAYSRPDGESCNPGNPRRPRQCHAQMYRTILDRGINLGGRYIEIWPSDAVQFRDALAGAQMKISAR